MQVHQEDKKNLWTHKDFWAICVILERKVFGRSIPYYCLKQRKSMCSELRESHSTHYINCYVGLSYIVSKEISSISLLQMKFGHKQHITFWHRVKCIFFAAICCTICKILSLIRKLRFMWKKFIHCLYSTYILSDTFLPNTAWHFDESWTYLANL